MTLANQAVLAGKSLTIAIPLSSPAGFKLNSRSSITYRALGNKGQKVIAADALGTRRKAQPSGNSVATATLAMTGTAGKATIELAVSYQICREGKSGLCKLVTTRWVIPLTATADSKTTLLTLPAAPKIAPRKSGKKKPAAKKTTG